MIIIDDLISIVLTPASIVVCYHLIKHWWPLAWSFLNDGNRKPLAYISFGIVIYHFGSAFDGTYWALAWSSLISNHPMQAMLFDLGSATNIIFRQGAIIGGGYLQILGVLSFVKNEHELKYFNFQLLFSVLVGVIYVSWLLS